MQGLCIRGRSDDEQALELEDVEVSEDVLGIVMPRGYGEGSGQAESPLPRFSGLGADDGLRACSRLGRGRLGHWIGRG